MSTIRVARRNRFTTIDRATVNDPRLSFRARGVLMWLLDKPDDWQADARTIATAGSEGRDAVRAALAELEEHGYLVRRKYRGENGQWTSEHTIHERPQTVDQVGIPAPVDPHRSTRTGRSGHKTKTVTEDCYPPSPQGGDDATAARETFDAVMAVVHERSPKRPRAAEAVERRRRCADLIAKFPTAPVTLLASAVLGEPCPNLNLYRSASP